MFLLAFSINMLYLFFVIHPMNRTFPRFLTYDPRRRITAEEALEHEYFEVFISHIPSLSLRHNSYALLMLNLFENNKSFTRDEV